MLKTNPRSAEHLAAVIKFAADTNQLSSLLTLLHRLDNYGENTQFDKPKGEWPKTICHLGCDFAPHSFSFMLDRLDEDESVELGVPVYKPWFHGGLIYHGQHDGHGSGAGPSFATCLVPTSGWSIHT